MKKSIFLSLSALALLISCWFLSDRDPEPVCVEISKEGFPQIEAKVDKDKVYLELLLSSKFPASLSGKHYCSKAVPGQSLAEWKDIEGKTYQSFLIKLNSLELASIRQRDIIVLFDKESEEKTGSVTWPFPRSNLLLDLPHRRLYAAGKKSSLSRLGYDLSKMKKIKCCYEDKLIWFEAQTDLGPLKVGLNTGISASIIQERFASQQFSDDLLSNVWFTSTKSLKSMGLTLC